MTMSCKAALLRLFESTCYPEDSFFLVRKVADRPIVVYGAGESFHYFKEVVMRRYGYTPVAIVDRRFSREQIFEGIPGYPADNYRPSRELAEKGVAVVCLGKQSYFDDVVRTLTEAGFKDILPLGNIYEIHNPFRLPAELEHEGFGYYTNRRKQIAECIDLLEDGESREVYLRALQTHMQRKPAAIPMRPRAEQYTPRGIRLTRGYSRYLYCGVSIGEMAGVFDRIGKVNELVCFEPDPRQFAQTAEYLSTNHERIAERVTANPCAVYSHDGIEPFTTSDTSFGSRILPEGNTFVQCVTIDHALPGFRPTFISMDIEGAELEALKGAERTITLHRPDLAVCVYHSPSHLWEIPLYLHGLGLGYRFYLRNYTSFIGETVLYAAT
jgi:FkbM family methyltransferase